MAVIVAALARPYKGFVSAIRYAAHHDFSRGTKILRLGCRVFQRFGNYQASACSSLVLGVAELVRVRVFLKSHDFSYPKTKPWRGTSLSFLSEVAGR